MKLIFRVDSVHNQSPEQLLEFTFDKKGGTIGRGLLNDWVLPDEQKFLSRNHAKIEFNKKEFLIYDTSANGIFLDASSKKIGQNNFVKLESGMKILMGGYVIEASIIKATLDSDYAVTDNDINHLIPDPVDDIDNLIPDPVDDIDNLIPDPVGDIDNLIPDPVDDIDNLIPDPVGDINRHLPPSPDRDVDPIDELLKDILPVNLPDTPTNSEPSEPNTKHEPLQGAFLKGAGLDVDLFPEGLTPQQMELIGSLFRASIQGTLEILLSRTQIKNEMHMDMTTIQHLQNNPIKFSVDADEAMKRLLMPQNNSYMKPEAAILEAFDDIRAHQIAIISGIQASLMHILKRFEPQEIKLRLEKLNPIAAKIPIRKQVRWWREFEDLYDTIQNEAEDDFNRLFGQVFAKAYDQQIEALKAQREGE